MALRIIDHGTKEYQQMVNLRLEILRKPLGLSFDPAELEKEKDDVLMGAFVRSFDVVWVLTRAGFGTQVVVTYLYGEAFRYGHFDRATAMGYILLVIAGVISLAYSAILKDQDPHD